jgi:hypothetical protein
MPARLPVHLVAAVLLALATPGPAAAEEDPMEAQRCVWRCLSESRGASDPAYHACVRAQCSAAPRARGDGRAASRPPARGPHWQRAAGTPYPAVAECLPDNTNLCLLVSCPARGRMSLELYAVENGWGPGMPLTLRAGASQFNLTLPARGGNDLFRWPMDPFLLEVLKSESEVRLDGNDDQIRLTLAGSGAAIRSVEANCR